MFRLFFVLDVFRRFYMAVELLVELTVSRFSFLKPGFDVHSDGVLHCFTF